MAQLLGVQMTSLPGKEDMEKLLNDELSNLSPVEKSYIESIMIPLQKKELLWEYGDGEPYEAWVFADFKERDVGALYCKGGFGDMGSPWGLTFFHDNSFGMDCGWYRNLQELIQDGWLD